MALGHCTLDHTAKIRMGGDLPLLVMASVHVPHAVQNKGGISRLVFCGWKVFVDLYGGLTNHFRESCSLSMNMYQFQRIVPCQGASILPKAAYRVWGDEKD